MRLNSMRFTRRSVVIIAVLAAVVALAIAAAIFMPRIMRRLNAAEPANMTPNVTVIRANVGQGLSESDLREVENIVRGIVGDRFRSAERIDGFAPAFSMEAHGFYFEEMAEADYVRIRAELIGDRVVITSLVLTPEESFEVYTAVGEHFGFDFEGGRTLNNREINDIFMPELN